MNLDILTPIVQNRLNTLFEFYFKEKTYPSKTLQEAMAYSTCTTGKLLRPLLVYLIAKTFQAPWEAADVPALAIEMIHSFSLIHDDLPAMDNATLRRGKPCCHSVYGEAMAILAGDALPMLAIEIITDHPAPLTIEQRLKMIRVLSQATGSAGMTGGQALDITPITANEDSILELYRLKTGALITACVKLGLIAAHQDHTAAEKSLIPAAEKIALAFQIQDDLMDLNPSEELSGKNVGIDQKNDKMTYALLVGKDKATFKVRELWQDAFSALHPLDVNTDLLKAFLNKLIDRSK